MHLWTKATVTQGTNDVKYPDTRVHATFSNKEFKQVTTTEKLDKAAYHQWIKDETKLCIMHIQYQHNELTQS